MAEVELLGGLWRERDATELREHRRDLDVPAIRNLEGVAQLDHVSVDLSRAAEGHRVRQRQHVRQRLHAARVFSRSSRSAEIRRCCSEAASTAARSRLGRAWLGQEPGDLPIVHLGRGELDVRVAGEEHADRVRRRLANPGEKLGAVHLGHSHVGQDDGEPAARDVLESEGAGGRGDDVEFSASGEESGPPEPGARRPRRGGRERGCFAAWVPRCSPVGRVACFGPDPRFAGACGPAASSRHGSLMGTAPSSRSARAASRLQPSSLSITPSAPRYAMSNVSWALSAPLSASCVSTFATWTAATASSANGLTRDGS